MTPSPLHDSHAPLLLNENSPASTALASASSLRRSSIAPVYVAGVDRLDVPIADWSITTASGCAGTKHSCTSELLPRRRR
jgi:hypothetical protein